MKKEDIIRELKSVKKAYASDGLIILGIFGSYAKDLQKENSDIDLAYSLDEKIFFKKFKGFKSVSKLAQVKIELENVLKSKIDLISINCSNEDLSTNIKKDLIYV